ncbi:hypothetical protein J3F84DRAFT_2229 [Trichoderma pleuroticola]
MQDGPIENLPDSLCVLVHGGYTANPELLLLVDKVSIERPKRLHLPGLGARKTLNSPQGNVCTWPYMSPMELSVSVSLSRAPLFLHRTCTSAHTHALSEVAHKEDGSCTQAYPVHLLEGARFEQAPH